MNFLHRLKATRNSYLLTLLVLGIVVMSAYISSRHFVRYDMTLTQQYAITDASKALMHDLDDIVTVKVFFSQELPPNLFTVRQYAEDVLQELASYANDNLSIQFADVSQEGIAQEAERLGIQPVRMNILTKDRFEVKSGYMGMAIFYGGRTEIIPVVQDTRNIEYDLVSSIRKITRSEVNVIGFAEGHGQYNPYEMRRKNRSFSLWRQALEKNYKIESVDLEAPISVNTLVIGAPRSTFSFNEIDHLRSFLANGGRVIALLDGVWVADDLSALSLRRLSGWLSDDYGVSVLPELVADLNNETASFRQDSFDFIVPYPLWVKPIREQMNMLHPLVNTLPYLVFPWASPISIEAEKSGVRVTPLISTSPDAWVQEEPFNLDPNSQEPRHANTNRYTLAALIESGGGKILLVGNARFATDEFVSRYPSHLAFLLDAVDFLTLNEQLSGIRPKGMVERPLLSLLPQARQWVKAVGIFFVPLLVVFYGLARFFQRRRKIVFNPVSS